jgi:hypothetical protein
MTAETHSAKQGANHASQERGPLIVGSAALHDI